MGIDIKDKVFQILFKIIVFILPGYFLIGSSIISPLDTLFSFTIYGLSLIFFYQALKKWSFKDFIIPVCIYAVVVIMTLMHISLISTFFRNFIIFMMLAAVAFGGVFFEKNITIKKIPYLIGIYWLISAIVLFAVSAVLNVYVFGLYLLTEYESFAMYLFNELKNGAIFGLGITIGNLMQIFFDSRPKR